MAPGTRATQLADRGESLETVAKKIEVPEHIAIVMDGNGRWAKEKGLRRVFGHENGTKSVRTTVETCAELGIENLTLYAFSTENWSRPTEEVKNIFKLRGTLFPRTFKMAKENAISVAIGIPAPDWVDVPKFKSKNNQTKFIKSKFKNLKMIIGFAAADLSHAEKEIKITPKYKKKFKSQVYIKKNTNNNSLF